MSSFLTILSLAGILVTPFSGFLYFIERLLRSWPLGKQMLLAALTTLIVIGLCAWSVKDKFLVNEEDLLRLREVASSSYEHGDYDATVKLITWAAKYKSNDEEFSIEYERALTIG